MRVWTIGHSSRTWDDFLNLLHAHGITALVDVRTHPGSRKYRHFDREVLAEALPAAAIVYRHLPALGGRRRVRPDSRNTAWRNASFRGYADHMDTPEFAAGIDELLAIAARQRTAFMCAEAVWWRCHRSLIADYLTARGHEVLHIIDRGPAKPHPYTSAARLIDGRLSYEAETDVSPSATPSLFD